MYVLTSKVRELLIFVLCVMMFIDLFIDWRESLSANLSDVIYRFGGKAYKVPVGSRTSSVDLVTDVNFKSVM